MKKVRSPFKGDRIRDRSAFWIELTSHMWLAISCIGAKILPSVDPKSSGNVTIKYYVKIKMKRKYQGNDTITSNQSLHTMTLFVFTYDTIKFTKESK